MDLTSVAPLTGAWIETGTGKDYDPNSVVAPLTGAWIETITADLKRNETGVAPLTGAWIETYAGDKDDAKQFGRAPHGRVD